MITVYMGCNAPYRTLLQIAQMHSERVQCIELPAYLSQQQEIIWADLLINTRFDVIIPTHYECFILRLLERCTVEQLKIIEVHIYYDENGDEKISAISMNLEPDPSGHGLEFKEQLKGGFFDKRAELLFPEET
jgi:hypothetical protein